MATKVVTEEEQRSMVKVQSRTYVKPMKSLGRKECQLVTYDLPWLGIYYHQKMFIYKGSCTKEFDDIVEKLKDGLRVVLEEFHQLAGKLGKDEGGAFSVVYDDDMDGVEVVVAAAEEVLNSDLMHEEGNIKLKEMVPYNDVLNIEGLHRPLLVVQVTKLNNGLVLGCAFNHAILDGTSTWHFLREWAQICSGSTSTLSVQPFLDRTRARKTCVKVDFTAQIGSASTETRPKLREEIFSFSESVVDKIKSRVNTNIPEGSKPFSAFQSLSTHVWHAITLARQLKSEDYTAFIVTADCRKRVDPPMPDSYFGNLIQSIFTRTTAGLLLMNPPEVTAAMIQNSIEMHDSKAIEKRNAEWERNPRVLKYRDVGVHFVSVGGSPRFKVYEMDFGWGKPERVRNGSNNRFNGMVYLYQGKSGGRSIDVDISLEAKAMENLEEDQNFLLGV